MYVEAPTKGSFVASWVIEIIAKEAMAAGIRYVATGMHGRREDSRRLAANAEEWLSTTKTDSDETSPAGITAMPAPIMRGTWLLRRKPLRRVTLSKRKIATSTLSITSGRCVRVRGEEESDNHAKRLAFSFVRIARWRLLVPLCADTLTKE